MYSLSFGLDLSKVEFPKKNGHGVKDYPAFSYSAGET